MIWQPTDDSSYLKHPFFAKHPREIMSKGEFNAVPTMIGANKDEGLLYTAGFHADPQKYNCYKSEKSKCIAINFLGAYEDIDPLKAKAIEDYYFQDGINFETKEGFRNVTDALGDSGFLFGTDLMARQLASKSKTFYYHYEHVSSFFSLTDILANGKVGFVLNLLKSFFVEVKLPKLGASHCDELFYLFSLELLPISMKEERDVQMTNLMVKLWTNFATHHDPTLEDKSWPAYGSNKGHTYVRLSDSHISTEKDPARDQRLAFWYKIFNV